MATPVIGVEKKQDIFSSLLNKVPAMAGGAIGTVFGGPMGGALGAGLGGAIGKGISKDPDSLNVSSPVTRRMDVKKSDPVEILQQGKAQLSGMDDQTKSALEPVIDEALKRAITERGTY